jgi:hypothetical protein
MPQWRHGRPPLDELEQRLVRKLATSRHAPADWVWHAKMITRSWDGAREHECRRGREPPEDGARAPAGVQ